MTYIAMVYIARDDKRSFFTLNLSDLLYQSFGRYQPPRRLNMKPQIFVADAREFDADPAAHADIRWVEKYIGRRFN